MTFILAFLRSSVYGVFTRMPQDQQHGPFPYPWYHKNRFFAQRQNLCFDPVYDKSPYLQRSIKAFIIQAWKQLMSVSVMDFFGETHHILYFYNTSVVKYGFSAHPSEDLMLIGYEHLEIDLRSPVKDRYEIHLESAV